MSFASALKLKRSEILSGSTDFNPLPNNCPQEVFEQEIHDGPRSLIRVNFPLNEFDLIFGSIQ